MGGYFEAYRALVVSADDPLSEHRIQVEIPDISMDPTWAAAEQPTAALPTVGDEIWVRYEGGSIDHPVWTSEPGGSGPSGPNQSALLGTYHGVALDTNDPGGYQRVLVQVPDVSIEATWAMPDVAVTALPAVGDEIWVRYDSGSIDHPLWSGGSGTGGTGGDTAARDPLVQAHQGVVIENDDPGGYGRVAVEVPELWPGQSFWAFPAHEGLPTPAIGGPVSISYENGSEDHPIWSPA